MTVLDDRRPSDRVAELHQRVERCRERVVELARRWAEVSEQTRNRAQPLHCNHMEEVQQLRTVLDDLAREVSGLQTALETRGVIDQAKGMIMLREHCDAGGRSKCWCGSHRLRTGSCTTSRPRSWRALLGPAMARRDVVVVGASAGGVEDLWGLRSDEALGQSLFALDIGLPVDPLRPLVRNVLGGDDKSEVTGEAISRLGRLSAS